MFDFNQFQPLALLVGFVAGALVGSTGVGGAAFATPALVLGLGLPPSVAISTDAVFCAVIKLFGIKAHRSSLKGSMAHLKRALFASIPGALLGVLAVAYLGRMEGGEQILRRSLGVLLIVAATLTFRRSLKKGGHRNIGGTLPPAVFRPLNGVVGFLVGLTSIGAGSLFLPLLLAGIKASFATIVAIDIAQGFILALVVGAGHMAVGSVDFTLLLVLTIGGIPGIFFGAYLHRTVSPRALASTAASLIAVIGVRLVL